MFRMKSKPAGFSLVSVVVAGILLVSSLVIGTTDSSTSVLPGVALNDSHFVAIGTDNLTSMDSILYPSNYEIISNRPYIIRVDYHRDHFITEFEAELKAKQFIVKVFSNQSVEQLEIDRGLTDLFGALPRWIFYFENIDARVTVNAITGGIIGYSGSPIVCQGEVANQSTAENFAAAALKELGYHIPFNSRLVYIDEGHIFGTNFSTYYFRFQEVANNTMIDTGIGTIRFDLDGVSGGIERLLYQWIQVDEIPNHGIVSINAIGYGAVLTLNRISGGDFNEIGPQEFSLCWIMKDYRSGTTTAYDAYTGDVLYILDTFGAVHSQDELRMRFLMPLLISAIPATLLYLGTRKVLRRQI
jgi:hypothetical protein